MTPEGKRNFLVYLTLSFYSAIAGGASGESNPNYIAQYANASIGIYEGKNPSVGNIDVVGVKFFIRLPNGETHVAFLEVPKKSH